MDDVVEQPGKYRIYAGDDHMEFPIVIITGVSRSGKTLLGQLLGSMENVEHIDEPYLPLMLPVMWDKGLVDEDVAVMFFRAFTEELFNDMILLRTANFRPSDLSTIWERKTSDEIYSRLVDLYSRDDVRKYVRDNGSVLLYNLAETVPCLFD